MKDFSEHEAGLSRSSYVYARLRADIAARTLRPGERLRENELAERLGVSRTPVREALQRLQSEGLIGFAPQRGLIVTDLTAGQVMEIYAMREVLEGAAARFAATSASAMEIDSIRRILERCGQATDAAVAEAENVRLHDAISAAAHNDYLLRAMMVLRDALTLLGTTTLSAPGRLASAHLEHAAIVAAITAGDPDGAEQATRAHIREGSRIRMAMLFGA